MTRRRPARPRRPARRRSRHGPRRARAPRAAPRAAPHRKIESGRRNAWSLQSEALTLWTHYPSYGQIDASLWRRSNRFRGSQLSTFEWIIALLLGAVALSALGRRIKVPYPTFLAIGGVLLAFVPSGPSWTLQPDLALALFVAPVLLDAAYDTSLRDLRDNWLPVSTLVVLAVGVSTTAVALTAHGLVPDMPWAAAIALGAIVAPPDAAAATAILRQVNLPYRVLKILEGESLLNDASALLIYRVAVGAALVQHFEWSAFAPSIVLALAGSLVAGYLAGRAWLKLMPWVDEAPTAIILQFAGTFTVWIVAERIGLSGILTIVAYAITIARTAPART